jgi:ribose transport system ATP-binding protein
LLPQLSRNGVVDEARQRQLVERFIKDLGIRCSGPNQKVSELSGGNQQKVLLARWLAMNPRLLILDEPTRGIDVGTKQQIYHIVAALAAEGKSIIVISSELQEVIGLSHRVVVMRGGRMAGLLEGAEITEAEIMRYAAGIKQDGNDERLSA